MISSNKLPAGWQIKSIGSFSKVTTGATPLRAKHDRYFTGGTIPWIKTTDLNNSDIVDCEEKITEVAVKENSCTVLPVNTVLVAMYGGFKQIGRTGILKIPAATNQALSAIRVDEREVMPYFLLHYLNENVSQWKRLAASSRKDPNITRQDVLDYEVVLPPLVQQERIVTIAATWDNAIELQTRYLEQLRRRAAGLRNDLLLEKKRLADFSKPWQQVTIGSMVKEVKRPLIWNDDEEYSLISIRRRSGGAFLRERLFGHQILTKNLRTAKAGDFLISKMQIVHGASGLVPAELDDMKISGSYVALVARNPANFDMAFFDCMSKLPWFYHMCYVCSYGVHIEKMTFDLSDFLNETIRVPEVGEQRAIAEVLNTADAEIRLNERKLEALREQKSGLVQKLLNGEILLS